MKVALDLFFPTSQPVISVRKTETQPKFTITRVGFVYYGNGNLYIKISAFKAIHISF